jgi:hypothetical protein
MRRRCAIEQAGRGIERARGARLSTAAIVAVLTSGCANVVPPRGPQSGGLARASSGDAHSGRDDASSLGERPGGRSSGNAGGNASGGGIVEASVTSIAPMAGTELPAPSYREPLPRKVDPSSPAATYARLDARACRAEVARRALRVVTVKTAQPGVLAPIRLDGPMNGVELRAPGATSKHGILDCRLALVLDDWTRALRAAGITGVVIDNAYRPGAKLPGKKSPSQHALALALDVTRFSRGEAPPLSVGDWGARIGEVPCGPDAVAPPAEPVSVATRNLVCSMARGGFFHTLLTPSYDAAHGSHFHFDIQGDRDALVVR